MTVAINWLIRSLIIKGKGIVLYPLSLEVDHGKVVLGFSLAW
jgi:hypothetical protein